MIDWLRSFQFSRREKIVIVLISVVWLLTLYFCWGCVDFWTFIRYWVKYLDEGGLFNCYTHLEDAKHYLNYPPIWVTYLYLIRKPVLWALETDYHLALFFLKFGTFAFHVGFSAYLYKYINKKFAWYWFANPVFFVVSATLVHIDEVFCAVLFLFVMAVHKKQTYKVLVLFAIACLLKLQGCYLLPVVLAYLFIHKEPLVRKVKAVLLGGCIGVGTYLPFMISMRSWDVPFRIYLNGFYSNYDNMETPLSIHGFVMYFSQIFSKSLHKFLIKEFLEHLSLPLLIISILWFLYLVKKKLPFELCIFAYFYTLFYITCSQDNRYFTYTVMLTGCLTFVFGYEEYQYFWKRMWIIFMIPIIMNTIFVFLGEGLPEPVLVVQVICGILGYTFVYINAYLLFVKSTGLLCKRAGIGRKKVT